MCRGINLKVHLQKGLHKSVRDKIKRIRKLCGSVEMYVVRLGGFKSTKITSSKPCIRCSSQLKLLGFKKINYIDEEKKECCRLKMDEDTQISWGLKNVRKQTVQVARTYTSSRCLSYSSGESSDESDTDD